MEKISGLHFSQVSLDGPIGFFIPSFRGGGAELSAITIANGFAARGTRTHLIVGDSSGPNKTQVSKAVKIIDLQAKHVWRTFLPLVTYLRSEKPVVLFSFLHHANIMAIVCREASRAKCKVVVSVRSTEQNPNWKERLVLSLARMLYRRADLVHAISRTLAEHVERTMGLAPNSVQVVYNPVNLEKISVPSSAISKITAPYATTEHFIVGMGRLVWQKDFITLIRAFALLRARHVELKLIILGEGPLRNILELEAKRLGVERDVLMPGFVDNPFPVLRKSLVFVLSSIHEGFANVIPEAMACGIPIVSTDIVAGPAEILEGGKFGKLVPPQNPKAMAEAISDTLASKHHPDVKLRAKFFSLERSLDGYSKMAQ